MRNPQTFDDLSAVLEYTKPLSQICHALESNTLRFADFLPMAVKTHGDIHSIRLRRASEASHNLLADLCQKRLFGINISPNRVVLIRPEHYSATVLDPIFRVSDVSPHDVGYAVRSIDKYYLDDDFAREFATTQFQEYCLREGVFDGSISQGLMWRDSRCNEKLSSSLAFAKRKNTLRSKAISWWMLYGRLAPELQKFAISLACTCPQAVSADRSFSMQNCVHTVRRSRLSVSSVDKATYC